MDSKRNIERVKGAVMPVAGALILALAVLLFLSAIRASLFSDQGEETRIWFEVTFLLLLAVLAELLVIYLRQPVVMVLLLVGVLVAPGTVKLLWPMVAQTLNAFLAYFAASIPAQAPHLIPLEGTVMVFAKLGSIILLFKIGLHSEITKIFNAKNFAVALLGVIIPFAAGFAYAQMTGGSTAYALFLGAALTATSVGVTVAVLAEFGVMHKPYAQIILGAAVIDDILALLALSFVKNVPTALTAEALAPLAVVLATAAVFVIGGISLGRLIVRKYFNRVTQETFSNKTFLLALAFLLMYAYVAEVVGLSAIVGAFIAGVTLNYSRIVAKINELMAPLEMLFTPIFFISLGMFVDIAAIPAQLLPIIAITLIAALTKVAGYGIAALAAGAGRKDAIIVGVGMIPRGEIALIVALYGLTATVNGVQAITPAEYTVITAMAFLTTVIVPPVLQKLVATDGRHAAPQ
ncbi:MAG: cation:proton antiporter [Candidatus Micrarchaeota archaeon]